MARRNRSKSLRDSFVYELRSVNLANLPEKEQGAVLDRFASFLDSLTEPITFHIVQDEREVEAVGALYQVPYKRFFVETHSQVDSLVLKLGTRMTRVHAIPSIKMARRPPEVHRGFRGPLRPDLLHHAARRDARSRVPRRALPDRALDHGRCRPDRHLRCQEDSKVLRQIRRFEARPQADRREVARPRGAGGVPEGLRRRAAHRRGQGEALQDADTDRPASDELRGARRRTERS